jgi:hypothetical protein
MDDIAEAVTGVLRRVAEQRGLTVPSVAGHHTLTGDLGLKSLDLAQVLALLDRQLRADPFARLVPITSVRTVGDLCAAYRRYFEDTAAGPDTAGVSEGIERAARRQAARPPAPEVGEGGHG